MEDTNAPSSWPLPQNPDVPFFRAAKASRALQASHRTPLPRPSCSDQISCSRTCRSRASGVALSRVEFVHHKALVHFAVTVVDQEDPTHRTRHRCVESRHRAGTSAGPDRGLCQGTCCRDRQHSPTGWRIQIVEHVVCADEERVHSLGFQESWRCCGWKYCQRTCVAATSFVPPRGAAECFQESDSRLSLIPRELHVVRFESVSLVVKNHVRTVCAPRQPRWTRWFTFLSLCTHRCPPIQEQQVYTPSTCTW